MLSAGFMCRAAEVQHKLRNQLRTESGPLDSSFSVPVGHNSCCSRRAAAVSPGRLRQPARSPIHSIMRHTTTTDCSISAGVSHPSHPCPTPGWDGKTHIAEFLPSDSRGCPMCPMQIRTYRTYRRAYAHSHTPVIDMLSGWDRWDTPKFRVLNRRDRRSTLRSGVLPPGGTRVGHRGTPSERWSG